MEEQLRRRDKILSVFRLQTNVFEQTVLSDISNLQLNENELRELIVAALDDELTPQLVEKILTNKWTAQRAQRSQQQSHLEQELKGLFVSTKDDDEENAVTRDNDKSKDSNSRLYTLSGFQGEEWRKWSGNSQPSAQVERQLRTLAPNKKGPKLIIPFKPAVWKKMEREEKQATEAAAAAVLTAEESSPCQPQQTSSPTKRAHGHDNNYQDIYDSFEDFIRHSPFLSHLSTDQILSLENSMIEEDFQDGQVIATEGLPVAVTLLRMGQVSVTHAKAPGSSLQEVECATLKSGDVFGYQIFNNNNQGTATDDDLEVVSTATFRAMGGPVQIYSCSLSTFVNILRDDDEHQPLHRKRLYDRLSRALHLWCMTLSHKTCPHDLCIRREVNSSLHTWQQMLSQCKNQEVRNRLEQYSTMVYEFLTPEFDFRDIVTVLLQRLTMIFDVDRLSLYSLDKPNNIMHLFTSTLMMGLRMPLKGVAAYVAQSGALLNLEDCYESSYFDSAMDVKTGYRSKQMLCIPIINRGHMVIGVIQLINPKDNQPFGSVAEKLGMFIAMMLSPLFTAMQAKELNYITIKPTVQLLSHTQNVSVHVHRLLTTVEHRHLKYQCRVMEQGFDLTPPRTSILYTTTTVSMMKSVLFNSPITFNRLEYSRLTPQTWLVFEFTSKNGHPAGWSIVSFYTYDHFMCNGVVEIPVFAGLLPSDWMEIMQCYQFACQLELFQATAAAAAATGDVDSSAVISSAQPLVCGTLKIGFNPFAGTLATPQQASQQQAYAGYYEASSSLTTAHQSLILFSEYQQAHLFSDPPAISLSTWLTSLGMPEAKRRKMMNTLLAHNIIITSAMAEFDQEVQEFLSSNREVIMNKVPQLFLLFIFRMERGLQVDRMTWLISSLSQWNRLTSCHILPLLDLLFVNSNLHTFAVSVLWTLPYDHVLMIKYILCQVLVSQPYLDTSYHRFFMWIMTIQSQLTASLTLLWEVLLIPSSNHAVMAGKEMLLQRELWQDVSTMHRNKISNAILFLKDIHETYEQLVLRGEIRLKDTRALNLACEEFTSRLQELWQGKAISTPFSKDDEFQKVDTVKHGSYLAKEVYLFTLQPSTTVYNNSSVPSAVTFQYCPMGCNYHMEHIIHHMTQCMSFILAQNNCSLQLPSQEIFALQSILPDQVTNAVIAEYIPNLVTVNYLIVEAVNAFNKANKPQNMFSIRRQATPIMNKIPDDLLLSFFRGSSSTTSSTGRQQQQVAVDEEMLVTYQNALAAYLLTSHVLGLTGITANNTFVGRNGEILAKNATSLLGLESMVYQQTTERNRSSVRAVKKAPIFFLPFLIETIGGLNGNRYREVQNLINVSYLALREHAGMLMWSMKKLFISHDFGAEEIEVAAMSLKEALCLDAVDDEFAKQQLWESLNKGLKADYTLRVK